MGRWLIRIGGLLFCLGLFLVSPLADLMPVELAGLVGRPAASAHFRVVAADEPWANTGIALILIGLVLLCTGLFIKHRAE